jgi:hypothetical protein
VGAGRGDEFVRCFQLAAGDVPEAVATMRLVLVELLARIPSGRDAGRGRPAS